jgi:SSS family transporter
MDSLEQVRILVDIHTLMLAKLSFGDYSVMVLYLLGVIGVGVWFSRGGSDTESYLLGGRNMPWWLIGISYVVSLLSTLTMVGVPGEAYSHGVTLAIGSFMSPIFAILAFHIFVRFYFINRVFTPFDYLERRFSPGIRGLAAGFFWLTRVIYIGLVLYASAKVFTGACNWPVWITILTVGGVGTIYTLLGGLKAVVWSDFIQFIVLIAGVGLIVAYAVADVPGGAVGVITYAFEHGRGAPEIAEPGFYGFNLNARVTFFGLAAVLINEQLFFNSSDQIALQRLLSTSSYRQAKRSLYTSVLLVAPLVLVLWFLGLAIFGFYGQLPAEQRPEQGDLALFQFIATQLPTPIPGLIIAAMLAAIMSTLDSGINSLATVATKDFYTRFFRPNASESNQVAFARVMTLVTGVLAILIGLGLNLTSEGIGATVLETATAWVSLSVALPPIFLLGVCSRRATCVDALVQLIVGWVVTASMLIWYLTSQNQPDGGISFMIVGLPGPLLAIAIGWLLSRRHPPLPESQIRGLTFRSLLSNEIPKQ